MTTHARNRLEFQLESTSQDFKSLKNFAPVDIFCAQLVDGEGKESTRLLFRIRGGTAFYFLFAKGTEEGMRTAAPWLQKELERQISQFGDIQEPIPEKKVESLPTGGQLGA